MAKGKSGKEKQDQVYAEFQRIIRNEKYAKPTLVEQIIAETKRKQETYKPKPVEFRSFYNPDSPLRGSSSWTKQQWEDYKSKQKAEKRAATLAARETK
jgi:hypothetical protein